MLVSKSHATVKSTAGKGKRNEGDRCFFDLPECPFDTMLRSAIYLIVQPKHIYSVVQPKRRFAKVIGRAKVKRRDIFDMDETEIICFTK
jgi:hypothetical protein